MHSPLVVRSLARAAAAWLIALLVPATAAASITEIPLGDDSAPSGITAGPDGALWATLLGSGLGSDRIARITTSGGVTGFPIPSPASLPTEITTGSDGALWFTERLGRIGRITTAGAASEFPLPGSDRSPVGIAAGPDGALWFTDVFRNQIGRITTAGAVTFFTLAAGNGPPIGIAAGPDGALWFTDVNARSIGRITTAGAITELPIPDALARPFGIVTGPDGALWFTDDGGNAIWRLTTAGSFTRFSIPTPTSSPGAITVGADGALWFVERFANKIGRITTGGDISDFRIPTPASSPQGIAAGPDGALWFTEQGGDKIGRITTDQPLEDAIDGTLFTEPPCDPPQIGCTKPRFRVGASSDASGENAFGTVFFITGERAGTFENPGTVTCLSVRGNRATVGVNFEFPLDVTNPGSQSALLFFEDNGPAEQDRFAVQPLPGSTAPSQCPPSPPAGIVLGPGYPDAGVPSPGVVIRDAPALPITKADCRHGGYARFGFKNQGRCIAFVVRQALGACLAERNRIGAVAFRRKYGGGHGDGYAFLRCVFVRVDPKS